MTKKIRDILAGEKRKRLFFPPRLNRQRLRSHRLFNITLFIVIIGSISLFLILYSLNPQIGNIFLFSLIFIVTFILVARFHHLQITIILIACSISILLASLLLESFQWSHVVDHYMEWEVLAVVLGMSIMVEATAETGLFDWVIVRMMQVSKGAVTPLFLMTFLLTLILSTVLANVTAMILISSMVFTICQALDYDPTPFLLAAVLATDLAGMATLISSLPAILVGTTAGIGFIDFFLISLPFVIISIPICILYLHKFFPPEKIPLSKASNGIDTEMILSLDPWGVIESKKQFYLAAVSIGITIIGFALAQLLTIPIGVVAIIGGIVAMVLTGTEENLLLSRLNWGTLLFFGGLFVLVGILEETEVLVHLATWLKAISGEDLLLSGILILFITALFSGLLDNIPVTAALLPVVGDMNMIHTDTHFKYFIICFVPISVLLLILGGIYLSFLAFILEVI
ncbi:MAG: SLC13 family permease [Candidatus Kariarchaeaceae archaeon]|jgi:Na+/H+ antiporter NhaD/arsenite permease-like protein